MTHGELEKLPKKLVETFSELEIRIMSDIVRRIKENGFSSASSDWEITRLEQLGKSEKEIKGWIQDALSASDEEIERIFSDEVYEQYMGHARAYKASGLDQIPFDENTPLQRLIEATKEQISGEYENLAGSMGFAIRGPDGKIIYSPLMEYYRTTMDAAVIDIQSGAFSYQTVLDRTINQMTTSGLRWIDYDSGARNRVDVAARRAVLTGFRQVQGKINEQVAADLKTDSYEVTYHVGARPSHQPWQGKVWTMAQLQSVCGLGTVTGLHGANCYHDYNAFIPGVSVRTYTDEQLEKMIADENKPKEYLGKKYTTYEALQHQRQMETVMRKYRQDIKLLQDGGGTEDSIILKKAKYQGKLQEYEAFSKKMGLPMQKQRIYQDGLRGKFSLTTEEYISLVEKMNSGIIKNREPSEAMKSIKKYCEANNVEYRKVRKLSKKLSSQEIINRISGGDMTKGSCSSLAFAYIGNKNGIDVIDFRGGGSQYVFSLNANIQKMLELPGIKGSITKVKKEISGTIELLNTLEINKEYYLATGRHAAIVRRIDSGLEYLELQSNIENGWMPFDRYGSTASTLNKRFGCRKTVDRSFGMVWEKPVVLMEVDSFNGNEEFEEILGYINTAVNNQKKGVSGNAK